MGNQPATERIPACVGRPPPCIVRAIVDDDLQFRRAEPVPQAEPDQTVRCVVCRTPITGEYFHAQGQVVCPDCAARVEASQKAPPRISLGTAALYGGAAAIACCIGYALVEIVTGLELGILALFVGIGIGRAVRAGSKGRGGRPQQILAVVLTYFAISVSSVPVMLYHFSKQQNQAPKADTTQQQQIQPADPPQTLSVTSILLPLLALGLASPFLQLTGNIGSGLLSLIILFFGMQRAWAITGGSEILVSGPYKLESV
jgi:hypothetical protein